MYWGIVSENYFYLKRNKNEKAEGTIKLKSGVDIFISTAVFDI